MKVRAKLLGWDEASASNAADFPDPELPTYEGLSPYVTGELKTQAVHVPEAGIHYRRYTVGGHVVDPKTVQPLASTPASFAPGLKVYNPDQPRDADGRWGSGGAVSSAPTPAPAAVGERVSWTQDGGQRVRYGRVTDASVPGKTTLIAEDSGRQVTLRNWQLTNVSQGSTRAPEPAPAPPAPTPAAAKPTGAGEPRWPATSTSTPEEREAVFTRLAQTNLNMAYLMNLNLFSALDTPPGQSIGAIAVKELAERGVGPLKTANDINFYTATLSALYGGREPPLGRTAVQRDVMNSARAALEHAQDKMDHAQDAAAVRDYFVKVAGATARGEALPPAPTLSREYSVRTDEGYLPQVGPEVAAQLSARLESQVNKDGTVSRLGGLAGSDFIEHDRVVSAGRELADKIDSRPDVAAAKTAYQEALKQGGYEGREAAGKALREYEGVQRDATMEELGKIRPMGGALKVRGDTALTGEASQAAQRNPADWVKLNNDRGPLTVKQVTKGRAYQSDATGTAGGIFLNPNDLRGGGVAVHELAHQMETTVPGLERLEAADFHSRTVGESAQALGGSYRSDESSYLDKFADPYMGKPYGARADSHYEIMSTAMGSLFGHDNKGTLEKLTGVAGPALGASGNIVTDPDTRALVLGALARL